MADNESDVLKRFKVAYKEGTNDHSDFYTEARRAFDFDGGEQWDDTDLENLKSQLRPGLTFNQVTPIINVVSGSEITNRYETKYLPRTVDDADLNDRLTELSRYIRQGCDAESEESSAFRDCVTAGLGAVEVYFDPLYGADGRIVIERVPIFQLRWDSSARKVNLEDRENQLRGKLVSGYYFKQAYGQDAYEEVKATGKERWLELGRSQPHDQTLADLYANGQAHYDGKKDEVLLFDFQERRVEPRFFGVTIDPRTGQPLQQYKDLSRAQFDELRQELDDGEYSFIKHDNYVYYRSLIGGEVVLEEGRSEIQDYTIKFMTGFLHQKDGGNKIQHFGLMRGLFDPQSWVNKMLSNIVYITSTNPKGAILGEKGAFEDAQKARKDWPKPNAFIELTPRALEKGKIKIVEGKYPASMERILNICLEMMPRVSGVNPFMSGQVDDLRRTAFSAVSSIQRQGMVSLSPLFDALRRYRKAQGIGGLLPKFIDKYMEEGTKVRITEGPEDTRGQVLEYDRSWLYDMEFDVVVDEAPSSTDSNTEFWSALQSQPDLVTYLVETGLMDPSIVADTLPGVSTTIRSRMKQNYERAQRQPPTMPNVPPQEGTN